MGEEGAKGRENEGGERKGRVREGRKVGEQEERKTLGVRGEETRRERMGYRMEGQRELSHT